MKKLVIFFSFLFAISFTANSQEIANNAIGLRLNSRSLKTIKPI